MFFQKTAIEPVLKQILKELQTGIVLDEKCMKMVFNFMCITSMY